MRVIENLFAFLISNLSMNVGILSDPYIIPSQIHRIYVFLFSHSDNQCTHSDCLQNARINGITANRRRDVTPRLGKAGVNTSQTHSLGFLHPQCIIRLRPQDKQPRVVVNSSFSLNSCNSTVCYSDSFDIFSVSSRRYCIGILKYKYRLCCHRTRLI